MALYQTYRPKDFHSLFGQTFVREVLQNALLQNRTVGAYLFHGSRGTGKTTVARILAKGVNCLSLTADGNPCGECQNCRDFDNGSLLDVIEIDAASNTGVDNIRDMIERAQFQPTQAPYKVYIIDEVHMLSKGAFNALLKTLEEPPKHVKFILATTEIHKIPDTIISRSQRFDFKRIKNEDIIEQLHNIAHSEGIQVEESALELIARLAKWGMRDAITLFEQYSVGGVLKKQYIEENLELIGDDFLSDFTEAIIAKDTEKTLKHLAFLREKSLDVRLFLEQLLFFLRDRMKDSLQKITFGGYAELFAIFEGIYGRLKFSPDPFLLLETSTFRCIVSDFPIYGEPVAHPVVLSHPPSSLSSSRPDTHHSSPHPNPLQPSPPAPLPEGEGREGIINTIPLVSAHREGNVNLPSLSRGRVGDGVVGSETGHKMVPKSEASTVGGATGTFDFARFVEHIRTVPKRSFVGLGLRVSTYSEDGNTIVIHPDNDFNYQKLDTADVRLFLQETLDTLFGTGYAIDIRKRGAPKKASPSLVDDAMDIF